MKEPQQTFKQCILKTQPSPNTILHCSGYWKACPKPTNQVNQLAVYDFSTHTTVPSLVSVPEKYLTDKATGKYYSVAGWIYKVEEFCLGSCDNVWGAYNTCYGCNSTQEDYTRSEEHCISKCPNRYWDRTDCQTGPRSGAYTTQTTLEALPDGERLACKCKLKP